MLLPIKRIPEGHSVLSQNVKLEGDDAHWLRADNLVCRAEIDRISAQVFIQIFFSGVVQLECSRCLEKFDNSIQGDFRIICEQKGFGAKKETEFSEDDIDIFFTGEDDEIDVTTLIYEELVLTLPMKPLCNEQCSGGVVEIISDDKETNLSDKEIDPRWNELVKLLKSKQ